MPKDVKTEAFDRQTSETVRDSIISRELEKSHGALLML
jgi:hypothetical protein